MTTNQKPKTIEEWRKERRKKAKREGGFILIPMDLWNGEAFHALSKSEKLILIECLAQLRYAPKSQKKRKALTDQRLFKCGLGYLLNNGEFGLPTKYLQERGIKGEDTISNAKKRLVEIGFFDVVVQGSFTKAGRFRYSDRWRSYNSGRLFKEKGEPHYDGTLPGYCHYPNIVLFNEKQRALKSVVSDDPETTIMNNPDVQMDLFGDYAGALYGGKIQQNKWYIYEMCENQSEIYDFRCAVIQGILETLLGKSKTVATFPWDLRTGKQGKSGVFRNLLRKEKMNN